MWLDDPAPVQEQEQEQEQEQQPAVQRARGGAASGRMFLLPSRYVCIAVKK